MELAHPKKKMKTKEQICRCILGSDADKKTRKWASCKHQGNNITDMEKIEALHHSNRLIWAYFLKAQNIFFTNDSLHLIIFQRNYTNFIVFHLESRLKKHFLRFDIFHLRLPNKQSPWRSKKIIHDVVLIQRR